MSGNKVIEYIIGAKDRTASVINGAVGRVKSFAVNVTSQLANVKAGFDMLSGVVTKFVGVFKSAISEAFAFEKATSDFKVLLGDIDSAKSHIEELRQFASSTPLTFGDLSKASKLLLSFGASAESIMPNLKMLGDISMGDAQKFQGLALVFAQVQSAGKLMGQDLLQMINQGFNPLTVISQQTGRSVSDLKDIMAEGGISFEMVAEAMRVATSEGGLFNGAMEEAAKTGAGLMSTLQDKWTDAVREFGNAFTDVSKNGIQTLIDKLTQLVESGDIEVWADKISSTVLSLGDSVKHVTGVFDFFWKAVKGTAGVAMAFGAGADSAAGNGLGFIDQIKTGAQTAKQMWNDTWYPQEAPREAEYQTDLRERAKARRASRKAAQAQAEPTKSLSEMLNEVEQKKADDKAADAAAKKAERDAIKAAEAAAKAEEAARLEVEKAVAAERKRLQSQTLDEYRKGLESAQRDASEAQSRLAAAQQKESQAWGWYRDKSSGYAQLQEERDNAAAEKQFEKDAARLQRKTDWRTRELSDDDEITRRVVLAREEKDAAEEYARETAEAAERAADALAVIQSAFSEGGSE